MERCFFGIPFFGEVRCSLGLVSMWGNRRSQPMTGSKQNESLPGSHKAHYKRPGGLEIKRFDCFFFNALRIIGASKLASFWGPYPYYTGSNPSIGGSKILRVGWFLLRCGSVTNHLFNHSSPPTKEKPGFKNCLPPLAFNIDVQKWWFGNVVPFKHGLFGYLSIYVKQIGWYFMSSCLYFKSDQLFKPHFWVWLPTCHASIFEIFGRQERYVRHKNSELFSTWSIPKTMVRSGMEGCLVGVLSWISHSNGTCG